MPELRSGTGIGICVQRLEQILREGAELNGELLACITDSQQCLRTADTARLALCLKKERELVDAIDRLEQRRKVVAATLASALEISCEQEVRLGDLAEALGEPAQSTLVELGEALRSSITAVREAGGVLRDSCESLLGHVTGLMQTIQAGLSKTKLYGRDGRIGVNEAVCGGLDLRT